MKMNNAKFFLPIVFWANINFLRAQKRLENELENYTIEIKGKLSKLVQSNHGNLKYWAKIKTGDFIVIPYCEINGKRISNANSVFNLINIRKDTMHFSYRIDYVNDSLFVVPHYMASGSLIDKEIYNSRDEILNSPMFLMSQYALNFSKCCFALKIRDNMEDAAGFIIVCYIMKDSLWVLGFNGWDNNGKIIIDKYLGIENYIGARYGSLENYLSFIESDSLRASYYQSAVELPKQILKESYFYYEKKIQADTNFALEMFLSEMDSLIILTKFQREALKKQVLSNINACINTDTTNEIEFLGRNVGSILTTVLTQEQALEYKKKYLLKRNFERGAFEKLLHAYEYWDFESNGHQQSDRGNGRYDSFNPLDKRALDFIFDGWPRK